MTISFLTEYVIITNRDEGKIMQCQVCKKNTATIHLTELIDGDRFESHLCESCAVQQGIKVHSQIPLNELLDNLLSEKSDSDKKATGVSDKRLCSQCGMTLEKIRAEGILGCPQDYEIFERDLMPLLKKVQGSKTIHTGKVPTGASSKTKLQATLLKLKKELQDALQCENYETAARLRDEMKEVKKK